MDKKKIAVVAVGGNALIKDKSRQSVQDQYDCAKDTMSHIVDMIEKGWDVIVSHGNGPQVGFILRRSEIARDQLHELPLDYCGADTQGAIGYMFQNALYNEFNRRGIKKDVATVVTQTVVDKDDPAFKNPTKPIGTFMDADEAKKRADNEGWTVVEDAGRGWRRVVPSPIPERIVEAGAINNLVSAGVTVVAVGGNNSSPSPIKSWGVARSLLILAFDKLRPWASFISLFSSSVSMHSQKYRPFCQVLSSTCNKIRLLMELFMDRLTGSIWPVLQITPWYASSAVMVRPHHSTDSGKSSPSGPSSP